MEENKLIEWVRKHSSKFFIILLCCVATAFFAGRSASSKKSHSTKDFIVMRQLFDRLQTGEPLAAESIQAAEAILSQHPELHPKYDPLLALSFFHQENSAKGIVYANAVLKRAEKLTSSPYQDYGNTSILIAQKKHADAFQQAQQLEEQLRDQTTFETLRVFNLLRLAFLAKEMGQPSLVKQAWECAQSLPSFAQVTPLFEEGSYTLKDFFASYLGS